MHGDELAGRELILELMSFFCDNYNRSAFIKTLIDNTRISMVPSINHYNSLILIYAHKLNSMSYLYIYKRDK